MVLFQVGRSSPLGFRFSLIASSCPAYISTMADKSQRQKGRGRVIPALNMTIDGLYIAKEATSTTPVNPVFGSVAILLTVIRVCPFLLRDETFQAHT